MKRTFFSFPPFLASLSEVKMGSSSLNLCFNLLIAFTSSLTHSVTLLIGNMSKGVKKFQLLEINGFVCSRKM